VARGYLKGFFIDGTPGVTAIAANPLDGILRQSPILIRFLLLVANHVAVAVVQLAARKCIPAFTNFKRLLIQHPPLIATVALHP